MDSFNQSRRQLLFIEIVSDFIEYLVYRSIEIYAIDQQCFATAITTHINSTMSVLNRDTGDCSVCSKLKKNQHKKLRYSFRNIAEGSD